MPTGDMPTFDAPIFMDNQSTTRVDPRVVEAMLPYFGEVYGNAGSTTHRFGWDARDAVDRARESIAAALGATPREIVFTSGATESNNLAIQGVLEHSRRRGNHIVSVRTEHKAVLDVLASLARRGCDVTLLDVEPAGSRQAGRIDVAELAAAIRDDTALVSVMLANNEIGVIQPIAEIATVCRARGVSLHCDATQAVGKMPIDVRELGVDLLSFSAHKIYGPKGVGALFIRRSSPSVRVEAQIVGGGQELGLRSGTLNVPGIVGLARALEICLEEQAAEAERLAELRGRLYNGFRARLGELLLNGPVIDDPALRLAGNLNLTFRYVEGQALLLDLQDKIALSSGSACTSANPEPSHVLKALGMADDDIRSSLRFGLGRFNTAGDVDAAVAVVSEAVIRLRKLSSMAT